MPKPRAATDKKERLAKYQGQLFDAWVELAELVEAEQEAHSAMGAKLQAKWDERNAEFQKKKAEWTTLVINLERKKFNLEARQRGKKPKFKDLKESADDLLRQAKTLLAELRGREELREEDSEAEIVDLFDRVEEEAWEETETAVSEEVLEDPDLIEDEDLEEVGEDAE